MSSNETKTPYLLQKILLLCGILEKCSCSALGGVRKRSKESNIRSIRSYAPGFPQGFGEDFPGAGNYGQVNYQNPDISSSYSTYGPNANSDFGSITYTNYPPTTTSIDGSFPFGGSSQSYSNGGISYSSSGVSNPFLTSNAFQNYPSYSSYPPSTSYASSFPGNYQSNQFNGQLSDGYSESFSRPTSFGGSSNTDIHLGSETTIRYPSKFFGSSMSNKPSEEAIFGPSGSTYFGNNVKPSSAHFSPSYKPNGNGGFANNLKGHDVEQVSQHIEVTRPVAVPIYKKFPVPKSKYIQVAIPHPVLVPFPQPYPVRIPIRFVSSTTLFAKFVHITLLPHYSEPVGVPVLKEIYIPVEKEVPYPVEKEVAVPGNFFKLKARVSF